MRPTTPGILLLVLVIAVLAAPVAALGQAQGPSALWDAYPLDQATTSPAPATVTPPAAESPVPAAPPAEAPEPSSDGGTPIWAVLAGALAILVVGGGVAIFTLARLRDRRQTATSARSAPAPEAVPEPDPVPVAEPVAVVAAPAPARAAEPVPAAATVAPPAPLPEPAPAPPPAAATARDAEEAAMADELELAELAAEYLWTVATGSRRPVVDLAARRFLRVGRAREMLGRARARGILTGAGRGRPGGALTEKGRRLLEAGSRSTRAPAWQEGAPPDVAPSDAGPAGPPHLRLADEESGPANDSPLKLGMTADDRDTAGPAFTVLEGGARKLS